MKTKLLILILSSFVLLSPSAMAAATNGMGSVTASALNVRETPDMDAPVKTTIPNGASVEIITKTGEWYEILYENEIFYVHSDYIAATRNKSAAARMIKEQSESGRKKAEEVISLAKSFLGVPYLWGGTSPDGFDCSGLVYYVYGEMGVDLYRVAKDMAKNGTAVDINHLMPGDIVLFWNRESYSEINHVGIYVGDGEFIHAPQTGDVVKITTLETGYYAKNLVAARRIFE